MLLLKAFLYIALIVAICHSSTADVSGDYLDICYGPNEVFMECGSPCPLTCANKDKYIRCKPGCVRGCFCKHGYVRDFSGRCIRPEYCQTCGKNEFFDCGSACDTTCATLGQPCPIININCNEMCYCIDGYARDNRNICIPISQCPRNRCLGPHEIFKQCGTKCPPTCDNRHPICSKDCSQGCFCKPGYIRENYGGECIPIEDCENSGCGGDPNAYSNRCGDPCPVTCENMNDLYPRPCRRICIPGGCKCKPGFVLKHPGICVLPDDCTYMGIYPIHREDEQ